MEIEISSLLILVSSFFVFCIFVLSKLGNRRRRPRNLPPGPTKLPLIGNLLSLIGSVPHRALHSLSHKYGPLMHLQLGELSVIVVSSSEAAEQVMKTQDINFASRPSTIVFEIIGYGSTSISSGPSAGAYWRQLKKICTVELLSVRRVQSFRSIREQVYADVIRWIGSMEGSRINLTQKLCSSTYDLISLAALGKKTLELEKLLEILKEAIHLASGFDVADLYPSLTPLQMVSGSRRRLVKLHKEADRILEDMIRDRKEVKKAEQVHGGGDLLDALLKYQDNDGQDIPLTNDNIKAVIVDILAGASDTSSTVMDWAMVEMLRNPRVMKKAQEEVRGIFGDKGYVDESSGIHELKYLKSIIKETLRIHAPVPLLLPRKCIQDCEINGYEIPMDTKIIVNAWAINRDPKYWKNAELFEPERFVDNNLVDFRGNHFDYIPFGAGRRMCPGMNFGLANVELPLAMFLYHFDWKLVDGEDLMDMTEGLSAITKRAKELCVVPFINRPLPHAKWLTQVI